MPFFVIDTSTEKGVLALLDGEEMKVIQVDHHGPLIQLLDSLIGQTSLTTIAVGIGPGSFTGTRLGLILAKTLAFANNLPLIPFVSLELFIPEKAKEYTICVTAHSRGYYALESGWTAPRLMQAPPRLAPFSPHPQRLSFPAQEVDVNLHTVKKRIHRLEPQDPLKITALYL